jgi:hypothetical protein
LKGELMAEERAAYDHRRQNGSALVITLLVLMAVTILGVMGMNAACVEITLSRTEREVQECFYMAEAAALEAIQRLKNTSNDDLNDHAHIWHHRRNKGKKPLDLRKPQNWLSDEQGEEIAVGSVLDADSFFAAVEWDVAVGASLIVTDSRLYANRIYGLSKRHNADTLIEIGYYLRY